MTHWIVPKATTGYAHARLERAVEALAALPMQGGPTARARAMAQIHRWRAVIEGMRGGALHASSRTPVGHTPTWATLEVAPGGFSTGRYLAEGELQEHELALLSQLPRAVPGRSARERLNHYFLSDAGMQALSAAVDAGQLHIELPEEGALPVVAALLARGYAAEALELIEVLRPLMHRLRLYPKLRARPRQTGATVHRLDVGEVVDKLCAVELPPRIATMNEALRVWNPLFDELVALWLATVDPAEVEVEDWPHLRRDQAGALTRHADNDQPVLAGAWPGKIMPAGWSERRQAWLEAYARAAAKHSRSAKHRHPKSNFARLRRALEAEPGTLTRRELGWVRRALASTLTKHGAPGLPFRTQLRELQAEIADLPTHPEMAAVLIARLARYPVDGGLPSLESINAPLGDDEHAELYGGVEMPAVLLDKIEGALEAPIAELVERGVIASSEVLASVLPQITAQVSAAGIDDPAVRELFAQIYAAFRRRRSLLLAHYARPVQLEDLPWIAALAPLRRPDAGVDVHVVDPRTFTRQTLEQVTTLALSAFPQSILPNALVREMEALVHASGLDLPLVRELAADVFTGDFPRAFSHSEVLTRRLLVGTLYARYYGLWTGSLGELPFGQRCTMRAYEARAREARDNVRETGRHSWIAQNGAILEQAQIMTTHNLAPLTLRLGLYENLRTHAPELVRQVFTWILQRWRQPSVHEHARALMVKHTAYAWRQAIFLLSLCEGAEQRHAVETFEAMVAAQPFALARRIAPVSAGLRLAFEGGGFDAHGRGRTRTGAPARRLLGWSIGPHWLL